MIGCLVMIALGLGLVAVAGIWVSFQVNDLRRRVDRLEKKEAPDAP